MKTIIKNFLTTLRRFKLSSSLNILGLSVSFAAFIIIMMQVYHDRSFDRFYPNADKIFRMELGVDSTMNQALVGRGWGNFVRDGFPEVEKGALLMKFSSIGNFFTTELNGEPQGFRQSAYTAEPDYFAMMGFDMLAGKLEGAGNVIIPQSMAQRIWGKTDVVGRRLNFTGSGDTTVYVSGIYRDFPRNSSVDNVVYSRWEENYFKNWGLWNFNFQLFVETDPAGSDALASKIYRDVQAANYIPQWIKDYKSVTLRSLPEVYHAKNVRYDPSPKGDASRTNILLGIAILIIVIAMINFINFATSLTPIRIRSLNTQKVFGTPTSVLRIALVLEAVGISVIAYAVALVVIKFVSMSGLASYFDVDIVPENNVWVLVAALPLTAVIGALTGLYPAIFSTKFPPALVLKGSFGMSAQGRRLRMVLVGFQFVISAGLIIAASFMNLQNGYLNTVDKGYSTDNVVVMELEPKIGYANRASFTERLKQNPQIEAVAFSQFKFGTGSTQVWNNVSCLPVSTDFLRVFGIEVVEGRDFVDHDSTDPNGGAVIVNRAAANALKAELGAVNPDWDQLKYVGFIDNIKFKTLHHTSEEPFIMPVTGVNLNYYMPWTYIKINGNPHTAVEHIRKTIAQIDPTYPVNIEFYDEVFNAVYQSERKNSALITAFSLLAIIISLVGTFGIVVFEMQYRRREIGIRKVFGSTSGEILAMFNRRFGIVVAVCFAVAAPISYIGVESWLEKFAFRVPLYWWVFAACLVVLAVITLGVVTIQSWRSANANPIESIKQNN